MTCRRYKEKDEVLMFGEEFCRVTLPFYTGHQKPALRVCKVSNSTCPCYNRRFYKLKEAQYLQI